jgi:hypothetical protein
MELDPTAWVVHRHLVDPCLDELDASRGSHPRTHADTSAGTSASTELGRGPIMPIGLPPDLWGLDTEALERLSLETRLVLVATEDVTSAG